jgi:hypothetical protein
MKVYLKKLKYFNKNLKLIDQYQSKMKGEQELEDLTLDAEEKRTSLKQI